MSIAHICISFFPVLMRKFHPRRETWAPFEWRDPNRSTLHCLHRTQLSQSIFAAAAVCVSFFFAAALALLCAPRRIIGLTFLPANNSFCAYRFAAHYEIFRTPQKKCRRELCRMRGQCRASGLIKKWAGSRVCWAESAPPRLSTRLTDYSHYLKPPMEPPLRFEYIYIHIFLLTLFTR